MMNLLRSCILCDSRRLVYQFSLAERRMVRCQDCGLLFLNPQPPEAALSRIYGDDYFLLSGCPADVEHVSRLKRSTAESYLDLAVKALGRSWGKLLDVGCGRGDLLAQAAKRGFEVTGVEISDSGCQSARSKLGGRGQVHCGTIDLLSGREGDFDVCILSDVIEHVPDPRQLMNTVYNLLKEGGVVLAVTPSLDSWSARFLKKKWLEFKEEHLFYFNQATIQGLFFRCGFRQLMVRPCVKVLSVDYIVKHFQRYPVARISRLLGWIARMLGPAVRRRPVSLTSSGLTIVARKQALPARPLVSVIMPVYNEAATVGRVIEQVLQKRLERADIELVIVESNSNDGSRQAVSRYADHPNVKLVFEEKPRGKGHAVRTGFGQARGDYILIQDADLEYDVEDYDVLLDPLLNHQEAFVLGSRHGGHTWKLRRFSGDPVRTFLFNAAHGFFCGLLNLVYGLKLKDPFTMHKVFRRDCLYGLSFECDRFDFDYELLIKLVRKGYRPVEIPVNYRSRSFGEGKKISVWRDPWTWIRAIVKYRFAEIGVVNQP